MVTLACHLPEPVADLAPVIREVQSSGASLRAIAAELTRRGIETPRKGGTWSAVQVKRVLERAA